jgi:hypothetical protein
MHSIGRLDRKRGSERLVWLLGGACLAFAAMASAQPATEEVEVDPLTCWWRASAGSVRVGQPFTLVLTCAVVETASTRVIPDLSRLDPAVVQLPPFEVVRGSRADDLRTAAQRFFQYTYTLRLISEDAFARDVGIPALQVSYRTETRTGPGAGSLGREQTYELPSLALRVASLVPSDAAAIREAPAMTLADIDRGFFRARALRIGAIVLASLGLLVLIAGLVRLARRSRVKKAERRTLGEAAILRAAGMELADAQRQARQGVWTPDVAGRALAALRIVVSAALGQRIGERAVERDRLTGDGELLVRGRWPGTAAVVWGAATPASLNESLRQNGADPLLSEVADGLARLTQSRYARDSGASGEAGSAADVDGALQSGVRLARRLAAQRGWLASRRADLKRAASRWRPGAWAS